MHLARHTRAAHQVGAVAAGPSTPPHLYDQGFSAAGRSSAAGCLRPPRCPTCHSATRATAGGRGRAGRATSSRRPSPTAAPRQPRAVAAAARRAARASRAARPLPSGAFPPSDAFPPRLHAAAAGARVRSAAEPAQQPKPAQPPQLACGAVACQRSVWLRAAAPHQPLLACAALAPRGHSRAYPPRHSRDSPPPSAPPHACAQRVRAPLPESSAAPSPPPLSPAAPPLSGLSTPPSAAPPASQCHPCQPLPPCATPFPPDAAHAPPWLRRRARGACQWRARGAPSRRAHVRREIAPPMGWGDGG